MGVGLVDAIAAGVGVLEMTAGGGQLLRGEISLGAVAAIGLAGVDQALRVVAIDREAAHLRVGAMVAALGNNAVRTPPI